MGPLHRWTAELSFASVTSRLQRARERAFRGIEVLQRGTSPRIVSAYVLGSKGHTLVSGPELAARLGLYDTWAYFSVRDSLGLHPEPDASGPASRPTRTDGPAGERERLPTKRGTGGRLGGHADDHDADCRARERERPGRASPAG